MAEGHALPIRASTNWLHSSISFQKQFDDTPWASRHSTRERITSQKQTHEDLSIAVEFDYAHDFGGLFNHELSHCGLRYPRPHLFA
jgi:hypothetical protein